ncbi:signal recognition particle-docking protein FtsY [Desulfovibrio inopinatus]|uniref:signal recognition particle-docking protein FtsY n=1 Tax=Desulfovibrio inopinatus TaxID=102109 RepID=UPI0004019BAA
MGFFTKIKSLWGNKEHEEEQNLQTESASSPSEAPPLEEDTPPPSEETGTAETQQIPEPPKKTRSFFDPDPEPIDTEEGTKLQPNAEIEQPEQFVEISEPETEPDLLQSTSELATDTVSEDVSQPESEPKPETVSPSELDVTVSEESIALDIEQQSTFFQVPEPEALSTPDQKITPEVDEILQPGFDVLGVPDTEPSVEAIPDHPHATEQKTEEEQEPEPKASAAPQAETTAEISDTSQPESVVLSVRENEPSLEASPEQLHAPELETPMEPETEPEPLVTPEQETSPEADDTPALPELESDGFEISAVAQDIEDNDDAELGTEAEIQIESESKTSDHTFHEEDTPLPEPVTSPSGQVNFDDARDISVNDTALEEDVFDAGEEFILELTDIVEEDLEEVPVTETIEESAAESPEPFQSVEEPQTEPVPSSLTDWQQRLLISLREAEPKLSVWLTILLEGVETAGPELWERLSFLFTCLEAPENETQDFIGRFRSWVEDMEYEEVEEFRSELQYRLALALELEDEEDERNRLFLKLSEGLNKTKEQISKQLDNLLSSHTTMDDDFWDEFEEILIMADVGFDPTRLLMDRLKARARKQGINDPAQFKDLLREELAEIFKSKPTIKAVNPPEVVLMIGVNGAGKTTTIAKLAHRAQMQGKRALVAAGDTFRAAAIEQLEIWSKRVDAGFYSKGEQADPAAVAFEALDIAVKEGYDIIFVDTAGRLHTQTNLMEELKKIKRVLAKKHPGSPHRTILVLDATTGQNALSQTKLFNQTVDIDEIVLTKLDGTAKGGVIVGIVLEYGIPITFVGLGEKMEDLRPFNGQDFAQALLT